MARKCMWALYRLYEDKKDTDALEQIKKLSICGDKMVETLALHHLEKLRINCKS